MVNWGLLSLSQMIAQHLKLYMEIKNEPAESRSMSLVGICDMLEDTMNKGVKRGKAGEEAKNFKFVFKGYAKSPVLTPEDKEAIAEESADVDGLAGTLSVLVESGYKVSVAFDRERKAYHAHLSACVGDNEGLVLGMYGRDLLRALAAVCFAHSRILKGRWREKPSLDESDVA